MWFPYERGRVVNIVEYGPLKSGAGGSGRRRAGLAAVAVVAALGVAGCGSGAPEAVSTADPAAAAPADAQPSVGEVVEIPVEGSTTVVSLKVPAGWKVRSTQRFDEPVGGSEPGADPVVSDTSRIELVPDGGDPSAVLRIMVRTGDVHSDDALASVAKRSASVEQRGASDSAQGRPDSTSSMVPVRGGTEALVTEIVDFDRAGGPLAVYAFAWQESPRVAVDVIGQYVDRAVVDDAVASFVLVAAPEGAR